MAATHSSTQIAKRYANALYQLAGNKAVGLMDEIQALKEIASLDDVAEFFNSPIYTRQQQASVVQALLEKQKFSPMIVQAVAGIAKNRRLNLLPEILAQFQSMVMQAEGVEEVEIVSAKELSAADVKKLTQHLSTMYNKKIHATTQVDASLIGGIILKMHDKLIDYSVAGKLGRLGQHLKTT